MHQCQVNLEASFGFGIFLANNAGFGVITQGMASTDSMARYMAMFVQQNILRLQVPVRAPRTKGTPRDTRIFAQAKSCSSLSPATLPKNKLEVQFAFRIFLTNFCRHFSSGCSRSLRIICTASIIRTPP